jgi:hypothetical protein
VATKAAVGMLAQDQFLAGAHKMLLALCSMPCPSSNPTSRSQVELSLVIVGGGGGVHKEILCVLSIGQEVL